MNIFNSDASVLGDLTINPSNGVGDILTISGTNVVTFRTAAQILSDIGAAASVHTHVEADITDLDKYTQAEVDALLAARDEIGELLDVNITAPAVRHVLAYDGVDSWDNRLLVEADISDLGNYTDTSEWATYSGTRAGGDLIVTLGDYDDSGNGIKIVIDDAGEDISFLSTNSITAGNIFRIQSTSGSGIYATLSAGDLTANRIFQFPDVAGTIALTSDIIDYSADDTAYGVSWNGNLDAATKNAIYDKIETLGSGGGDNYYSSIAPPQIFNPDAAEIIADTADFTLANTNPVLIVTINGQVLDDSEYSLVSSTLTVTPDNGFNYVTDEVAVFQTTFSAVISGFTRTLTQVDATYTILLSDYYVEATANTFTITLPPASGIAGQQFVIKNSGTGVITLEGDGAETIDGDLNKTLNQYDSLSVVSNGSNYIII